nr:PREDICTED: proton-coupled amino acid transporter-like protein pathetic [Bemisia tabaci]XP_018916527.1 PREDICTED: proton-coupled amino acid transporter-like protein pathetic [Bemisia tabaci]XP_018916528.1 PREDICTED: proton-coupled amino acid transporter-like protein pathetic [Bemisia tabaci]XP_018916529.1 PREDICTED: proton-coupled amino acid transporter-like protein pathetic [Bemisia tabaci]XP_018916530.1 PREDICTED: proton-coupled amino acid transporter-like protein pathetic [Bemisia tabaci]
MEMKSSESASNVTQVMTRSQQEKVFPPRQFKHATSDFETFLHIVKSSLGSGLLATPDAFKNAGIGLGLVGMAVAVLVITHATSILVRSSQAICCTLQKPHLTYADTAEYAFEYGNIPAVRPYAGFARKFVKVFSVITYYGVNTVYVVLIASSAKQLIENHIEWSLNIRWYILLVLVLILPLGIIKLMKFLAPFSAIANVCLFVGLGIILFKIMDDLPPLSERPFVAPIEKVPLFFATMLFGLEGIGTVLPVENEMKNPDHFLGWTGVLSVSMFFIGLVNAIVGLFGYWKYGDAVCGSISLNMEQDWLSELVKFLIAVAILFTYGLQMTVTSEVVWDSVQDYFHKDNSKVAYYCVRASLVVGTAIVAAIIPNLAPIISLFGAIGFSMLGLFCPAVIDFVLFYDVEKGLTDWRCWKNILLIIAAFSATFLGAYTSLADIISNYS